MQKKTWLSLFSLVLIFVINCLLANSNLVLADGEYRIKLDFGENRPVKDTIIDRILPATIDTEKIDRIIVDCNSTLTNQTGEQISFNRIKLAINDRSFDLDESPLEIDSKTLLSGDKFCRFMFTLKLTPADHPGRYEGTVIIQAQAKKFIVQLSVEVEPWVRMETDQNRITFDQVPHENLKLQNLLPLNIRVASNTNWVLSVDVAKDQCPLELKLEDQQLKSVAQAILPPGSCLGTGRRPLTAGTATVSEGCYWSEINLTFGIDNFISYPAGEHLVQFYFMLEQWDQKTVDL